MEIMNTILMERVRVKELLRSETERTYHNKKIELNDPDLSFVIVFEIKGQTECQRFF